MLPRTLLRRETRNKWTLRARVQRPRARWRGPTARTWLRTPKAPSRLCLPPLRPSIAAHVFISPEFLFMLSCVPAVASGPSSQRHVCPWCPCLPQTPHPSCRGSEGPGTRPGLLWGVHLAWVSPNLGHADPPPDSSSWTSVPVCPNKRVFSYPSWCLCSVRSGCDARGRSPENQPSSLLHPWTGRKTPKLPSVWGRGTRTLHPA